MGKFDHSCFESEYRPLCDAFVQINGRFYDKELVVVPVSSIRKIHEELQEMFVGTGVCVKQIE
jgi:hypothetical protein